MEGNLWSKEIFVGNLNKTKTRDEVYHSLCNIDIMATKSKLYIAKFDMPKLNARRDKECNLILNKGFAFITTPEETMATELVKRKIVVLDDGSCVEFRA